MIIGILQPGYLPWLGFFEQMSRSDVFVIYDDVQYDKEGWRNRNRIKSANGIQLLTVPVHVKLSE
ncbi:MAG: WbqC family protein, partial [Candidatus Omnitrophota bacterium]